LSIATSSGTLMIFRPTYWSERIQYQSAASPLKPRLILLAVSLGSTSARYLITGLYYLLPNLANYSFITPAAHGRTPSAGFVFATALYALVYIGVILAAATLIFSRRNFK
jgi:hypothetical protein